MNDRKKVSVIAPCYNVEKYIGKFLESVLLQDYPNIELILINDGSVDRTEEIILTYKSDLEKKGIQFVYIKQGNYGAAAAINKGLKIFRGDYLVWMDSDDVMLEKHISKKVDFLETRREYGFVLGQGEVVDSSNYNKRISIIKRSPSDPDDLFGDLIFEKNILYGPGAIMVRREAILKAIPSCHIFESREGQNWQLMLPLSYMFKCGYLNEVVFKCVSHSDSHSRTKRNKQEWVERYSNFETLITKTINEIGDMPYDEKNKWISIVHTKYLHRKLFVYRTIIGEFDNRKKLVKELKQNGDYQFTDTFFYLAASIIMRGVNKAKRLLIGRK